MIRLMAIYRRGDYIGRHRRDKGATFTVRAAMLTRYRIHRAHAKPQTRLTIDVVDVPPTDPLHEMPLYTARVTKEDPNMALMMFAVCATRYAGAVA